MGCCGQGGDWAADDQQITNEENRVEGTINYKVDDPRFVEMQKWPVILLDTTGSMNLQCEANDPKKRSDLVYETIWQIAQYLIPINTVDVNDVSNNYNNQLALLAKGIQLFTFNAIEGGVDRGLLHPNNFLNEWANIRYHGGTHIMDGWRKMLQSYENKFNDLSKDQWPLLLALIITDGELQDREEFEEHLKHVKGRVFVEVAVVGHGEDHDKAVQHYNKISKKHDHVRVTAFTGHLNPEIIVERLVSLIDPKFIQQVSASQLIPPSLQNYIVNNANNMQTYNNSNIIAPNNNVQAYNANISVMSTQSYNTNSSNDSGMYSNNMNNINNINNTVPYNNIGAPTAPYNPNY